MADDHSYPSPADAQQIGNGPFYGRPAPPEQSPPPQEIPDDLQLRADLARSLAPLANDPSQSPLDDDLLQDHGQYAAALGLHDPSPSDQLGQDAASKQRKEQRQKVSKACDECRRKKVHTTRVVLLQRVTHTFDRSNATRPRRTDPNPAQTASAPLFSAPTAANS